MSRKYRAAVITASDKGFAGKREDKSGPLVSEILSEQGFELVSYELLSDDRDILEKKMSEICDGGKADLLLTTGGTGFSPRDNVPEATLSIADKNVPGIAELMRLESLKITSRAALSRAVSVIRGRTLIINLPGSPKAAKENLEAVLPVLFHGLDILTENDGECAVTK